MAELDQTVGHSPKNNQPRKALSGFLYKAVLFAVFVALLPLFPSQFTEPGNHTLLSRTWELLHLLLVGIAVSYGLFSRRNDDADLEKDKDPNVKADTPQSYVSKILQVSPVFDDYAEAGAAGAGNESKIETWSSQYQTADPVVVVANGSGSTGKPLLLPVRSLKNSRVQNSDGLTESSVLPSPIPWRSRSGRLEAGDEGPAINASSRTPSFRSPPVPPPPPPPSFTHGSLFVEKRQVKKTFKDELKDLSQKGREGFLRSSHLVTEQKKPETPSSPRSAKTLRSKEAQSAERDPFMLQKMYHSETKEKKKKKKKIVVSDDSNSDDTGSDASDDDEPSKRPAETRAALQENEVDKKADEFIAKFREQIRLQRIESIKKSSGHKSVKNSD